MNRRQFVLSAAALAMAPPAHTAGPKRVVLFYGESAAGGAAIQREVEAGLAAEGLMPGHDVVVEVVAIPEWSERVRMADGILARQPDLIGTRGTDLTRLMQERTRDVPIVFRNVGDPVAAGLVQSLARPGGNVTGESNQSFVLEGKRLELLRELRPGLRRVAFIGTPGPAMDLARAQQRPQAAALGLEIDEFHVETDDDLGRLPEQFRKVKTEGAIFSVLNADHPGGAAVLGSLAARAIPAVFLDRRVVARGGLASLTMREELGPSTAIMARILRGANPATLPVALAARPHLALNKRTARAMNLKLPDSLLVRVDELVD